VRWGSIICAAIKIKSLSISLSSPESMRTRPGQLSSSTGVGPRPTDARRDLSYGSIGLHGSLPNRISNARRVLFRNCEAHPLPAQIHWYSQIGGELTTRERGLASGSRPAPPPAVTVTAA
jgi:hypothetical protein